MKRSIKIKKNNNEIIKSLPATPDLCITDEWHWNNLEVQVNYRGVVEIKSPILDYITGFEPSEYKCLTEIERHLKAKNNAKVILTDGVTWVFYNKESGLKPVIDPICLGELVYRYTVSKNNRPILARTKGGKPIIDDIIFKEDENKFISLKEALEKFITQM